MNSREIKLPPGPFHRDNYLAVLASELEQRERILREGQDAIAQLHGEKYMENAFQQGLYLHRAYAGDIQVPFLGKAAILKILDVEVGDSFDKKDSIRFTVYDTGSQGTYIADIALEREPGSHWMAREIAEPTENSLRRGNKQVKWIHASGLTDQYGALINGNGLSDRLRAVIASVSAVTFIEVV